MYLWKAIVIIFCMFFAFLTNFELWELGSQATGDKFDEYNLVFMITFISLLVLVVLNISLTLIYKQKHKSHTVKVLDDLSDNWQEDVVKGHRKSLKKLRILTTLTIVYTLFIVAVIFLYIYSRAYTQEEGSSVVFIPVLASIFYMFIAPLPKKTADYVIFDEKVFPKLHAIAKKACAQSRCRKNVILSYTENYIVVKHTLFSVVIFLNASIVQFLTEEELYNLIIYKLELDRNFENKRLNLHEQLYKRCQTIFSFFGKLFTSFIVCKTRIAFEQYKYYSPLYKEIVATQKVAKLADVQQLVNALAKEQLYKMYKNSENPEMNYSIYSSEKPPKDWYIKESNAFAKVKQKYGNIWQAQLTNELPHIQSATITLGMRMEILNCLHFDTTPATNDNYLDELEKLTKSGNHWMEEKLQVNYETIRNKYYTQPKQHFCTYRIFKNNHTVSNNQLIQCARYLYNIENEKVAEIAKFLIQQQSPWGYYMLAMTYLAVNDQQCVELFEKAMSTELLAVNCVQNICQLAINTGNKQLLDQYRNKTEEILEKSWENRTIREWKPEIDLEECTIELPLRKQLIEELVRQFGDDISEIYMASYRKNNVRTNVVTALFNEKLDEEKKNQHISTLFQVVANFAHDDIVPPSRLYHAQLLEIRKLNLALFYRSENYGD